MTGYSTCIDLEYVTKSCIVYFVSIVVLVVEDFIMVTIKTLGKKWEDPAIKVSRILLFWTELQSDWVPCLQALIQQNISAFAWLSACEQS